MAALATLPVAEDVEVVDELTILRPVPWSRFEAELARRGDAAGPRIAYLEGALELMSPSKDHERIKSFLACLLEASARPEQDAHESDRQPLHHAVADAPGEGARSLLRHERLLELAA